MVCIPCIVIPILLWVFHKYIQPFILKFWNPWEKKAIDNTAGDGSVGVGTDDSGAVETCEEYKYIQQKIKDNPVMIFSKTTCSYCKMAKDLMDTIGVSYTVEEIDLRPDTDKLQDIFAKITDARTVPRVYVGGKCVGGGSETWSIHNQGLLVPMLQTAGASFKKSD